MIPRDHPELTFIGSHVKKPVKEALKEQAKKEGVTMAALIRRFVTLKLRESGHELVEAK